MMRSIWKGSISFGLINIPVRLYGASRSRELKFKLLHKKDHSEIHYARICEAEGKEIPWEEIVKGYKYKKGDYVVLADEDFEKANLKKTKTIEILDFTYEDQIDTIYFKTPFYLEPEKGAANAYNLLREALKKSKKVAVGHFVLRNHEHLGVIKPHGDLLILNQLRYQSELIPPKDLQIPKEKAIPKRELDTALSLIDLLTKEFNPKKYADTYTEEVKALIAKKAKGGKLKPRKEKRARPAKIFPLLKKSLELHKKKARNRKAA